MYAFPNTLSNVAFNTDFRHAHNLDFDKSDLFFVCMLKPLSAQIKVDNLEIQAAKVSTSPYWCV